MNSANKILGIYKAFSGGITGAKVDVRIILSTALKIASTAIIVAHNHPSGNLLPSISDIKLTRKLVKASALVDIVLLDHLIVTGGNEYYSFKKNKVIQT